MEGDEDLKAGEGKKGVNSVGGAGCPATENCRLVTEVVPTRIPTLPQNNMCRYLLSGICFCIACAVLAGVWAFKGSITCIFLLLSFLPYGCGAGG